MKISHLLFAILLSGTNLFAQSPYPFGGISVSDLEMTTYEKDKEAAAVYLLDWGKAEINLTSDKILTVKKHFRIKILNAKGLDNANLRIISDLKRIPDLKAATYNLEDGNIVETKLNPKDIYVEKRPSDDYLLSIAFNNVKVGSIIECYYSQSYESVFQLYPWSFQHEIPVIKSEFTAIYPSFFEYKKELHHNNLDIKLIQTSKEFYLYSQQYLEITLSYEGTDLPAFEPEPFITSEVDYLARAEFELYRINSTYRDNYVTPSYSDLPKKLLEDENFGRVLEKTAFLKKIVAKITEDKQDNVAKIEAIRNYITDNVKWNGQTGIFSTYPSLKRNLRLQNGSIADVNLLLIAMLNQAGISAHPVVLSTRENGKLNPIIPIVTKFDYVLAYVRLNNKDYLIDASNKLYPYDQLPFECLNGNGRIIHTKASDWITLFNNEQLFDIVDLNVTIGEDESVEGKVKRAFGGYSASSMRKIIHDVSEEGYIEILKQYYGNYEYKNMKIENKDSLNKSLLITYDLKNNNGIQKTSDLCIINPVMFFAHKENPFTDIERKFPIDFGYKENEVYSIVINIPKEYKIEEIPASTTIKLPDEAAVFLYKAEQNDNQIIIKYRYVRSKTYFEATDYNNLRDFFNKMIKKQSDLIILKKTTNLSANNY
jgi:transglutaminase-like putative cysteine protease